MTPLIAICRAKTHIFKFYSPLKGTGALGELADSKSEVKYKLSSDILLYQKARGRSGNKGTCQKDTEAIKGSPSTTSDNIWAPDQLHPTEQTGSHEAMLGWKNKLQV